MRYEPFDPVAAARLIGLSCLPKPLNPQELGRALPQHYPQELSRSGVRDRVLLSLDLDESGAVVSARAIEPPASAATETRALLIDAATGEQREIRPARQAHPALRRAAEAAALVLRFSPAERDGQPVAFSDYRITVEMAPPA